MTATQILNAFFATLTGLAITLATLPAKAEPVGTRQACGPRAALVERLSRIFGETRRGIGMGGKDRVVEVFASETTGTWTITVTLPDGRSCLVTSGQDWEDRMDDLAHLADAKT
ncbi:hypothetical protein JSE7799_01567 [Jannaschia seosinensis]|uniref:Uncharacterized protein n=1 Tax=Jannaschia seosinensis TaxID=313367 RepID=A0A0M7B9H4_9RHOB|nr:hypothetical protein [Jannaschia seosinensis]CUH38849.1 hypothetical protein JSE7799_01567 [Jannaschia seosinensis]